MTVDAALAIKKFGVPVKCANHLDLRLRYRGTFDGTPEVVRFAENLEKVCIDTVESGDMTRDLAILIRADHPWLTTNQFLDKLDANLHKAMAA
jgi:isocitrate dehydrogenase